MDNKSNKEEDPRLYWQVPMKRLENWLTEKSLHTAPDTHATRSQGKVFPCCLSNTTVDDVVGDLNVQTIEEVYNGPNLEKCVKTFCTTKNIIVVQSVMTQEALGRTDSLRMKSNEEFLLQPNDWNKFENKMDLVKSDPEHRKSR